MRLEKLETLRNHSDLFHFVRRVAERDGRVARSTLGGELELRGEAQFPAQFPGVGVGSVGETQKGEHEGAEVLGRGEVAEQAAVLGLVY